MSRTCLRGRVVFIKKRVCSGSGLERGFKVMVSNILRNVKDNKDFSLLPESVLIEPEMIFEDEVIYRKNTDRVESVTKFSQKTGNKIKTIKYDYFDDKKIKSIDEFDEISGNKIKTTNFTLFKAVTEYDIQSGKKLRTLNYHFRDENKLSSIHEYNLQYGKVSKITVFRNDGKSVSMVKELNPETEMIEKCISFKRGSNTISSVSQYDFDGNKTIKTTMYYNGLSFNKPKDIKKCNFGGFKPISRTEKLKKDKLIDNLFKNKLTFSMLS